MPSAAAVAVDDACGCAMSKKAVVGAATHGNMGLCVVFAAHALSKLKF